jgi:GT2 family glycosyltransferase
MFSIIIPIGLGRDGRHALGSLLNSGLEEKDEVIVVGDGHLPSVHEFNQTLRLKIIQTPTAGGANQARNLGVQHASQPYLCFLDDDDAHLPHCLDRLRKCFQQNKEIGVWSLNWRTPSSSRIPFGRQKKILKEKHIWKRNVAGGCSSMVLRRDSFDAAGGFDDAMQSMQDWDLWLRLIRRSAIHLIQEPCILYRDHDGPRISTNQVTRIAGLTRLLKKHGSYWPAGVYAFHQARLASERYRAGEGASVSIFQARAPLASFYFGFKALCRKKP